MSFLSVQHVCGYSDNRLVVEDICFEQSRSENIAIAGETGSGKTSLLKMIGGLMQVSSGKVLLNGQRVVGPDEQLIAGHKKIAYLSQYFELRNNYRVEELLDMASKIPAAEAEKVYEICDIHHLLTRWSDELSGGEKQRISLARLLTTGPELLLLDEPYSNLDLLHKQQMKTVIAAAQKETGISCILVSHDALDILSWADVVFFMKDGHIIQRGTAYEVYNKPVNEYAAALLGNYNLLDISVLAQWKGPRQPGKKLFLRPSQIIIGQSSADSLQGIVQKVLFWGSYFTIDIAIGHQILSAQTSLLHCSPGQVIDFSFNINEAWF